MISNLIGCPTDGGKISSSRNDDKEKHECRMSRKPSGNAMETHHCSVGLIICLGEEMEKDVGLGGGCNKR